jgi:prolyl-tRNA synthetase
MVGGLVMAHGDDRGLRVPPALAPTQVVVMAVKAEAAAAVERIGADLAAVGVRTVVDTRTDVPFGRRAVDWELKGVPVRIELGPRDLEGGIATVVRRIAGADKVTAPLDGLVEQVVELLAAEQVDMLEQARRERDARIAEVNTVAEAIEASADGFGRIRWDVLGDAGEQELAQSAVTVRCLQRLDGSVPDSDTEPDLVAVVGRSY